MKTTSQLRAQIEEKPRNSGNKKEQASLCLSTGMRLSLKEKSGVPLWYWHISTNDDIVQKGKTQGV